MICVAYVKVKSWALINFLLSLREPFIHQLLQLVCLLT